MTRFCRNCGAALVAPSRFCGSCGAEAEAAPESTLPAAATPSAGGNASSRNVLLPVAVVLGVVAAIAIGGAYLLFTGDTGDRVAGIGLIIELPSGWDAVQQGDSRLVLMSPGATSTWSDGSVTASRLRVERSAGGSDLEDVLEAMFSDDVLEDALTLELVEEPVEVKVGPEDGVAITLSAVRGGTRIVTRYVFTGTSAGAAYVFLAEAPESEWSASSALFERLIASVRFQ
jgi:hypothetical protein